MTRRLFSRRSPTGVLAVVVLSLVAALLPQTPASAFCFGEDEQSSGSEPVSPTCRPTEAEKAVEGFAAAELNARRSKDLTGWSDLLMGARWWAEQLDWNGAPPHDPDLEVHVGHHDGVADLTGTASIPSSREDDVVDAVRGILEGWWSDPSTRAVWTDGSWDHVGVGAVIGSDAVIVVAQFRAAVGTPPRTWTTYPIDGGHSPWGSYDHPQFSDVGVDHLFARPVERMRQRHVTTGCNDTGTRYCPDGSVTRAQMAAFLVRALDLAPGTATFEDVPAGHTFRADIAALAAARVTLGCNDSGTRFCPDDPVSRGQMAAFLARAGVLDVGWTR